MTELFIGALVLFALFIFALYLALSVPQKIEQEFLRDLERARQLKRDEVIFPKKPYSVPTLVKSDENP